MTIAPSHQDQVLGALPRKKIGAILLAAGQSRRMGKQNKLTLQLGDKPIIRHAGEAILSAGISDVVVVVGHEEQQVMAALGNLDVRTVLNSDYAAGQAGSIKQGLSAVFDDLTDLMIALGDMPLLPSRFLQQLIAHHYQDDRHQERITIPRYWPERGSAAPVRGNPVIFGRHFFPALGQLSGDSGARQIMADYSAHISYFSSPDASIFADIDTVDALHSAQNLFR